jgi:crotonobetainyl-CoA:carnitine CoA-transferase CaiB-like acyl-CoA transferase
MIQSVVADKAAAHTATWAVLAALLARERGGQGQRVDVPMFDAYAAHMLTEALGPHSFADAPGSAVPHLFRSFETADGHVVGIASQDHQYAALCRALEREDLIEDPRFASIAARFQNIEAFYALLEAEIRKWSTVDFLARVRRFGAPFDPVHDFDAFRDDPQTAHNATLFEAADERAGAIRYLRPPARFGETPAALRRHPPRLSEHAEEILTEAGYSQARVRALREQGVIA